MGKWVVSIAVELVATLCICLGSVQSFALEKWLRSENAGGTNEVTAGTACVLPVFGSITLLLFFFLFTKIQDFVVLYMCVTSYMSVFGAVASALYGLQWTRATFSDRCISGAATVAALGVVLLWVLTDHWLAIDAIGVCLCTMMISFLRLRKLKVGVIAGAGLFVYDVFWVFFSHHIFKENVMVKVATQQARNPVQHIAERMRVPGAGSVSDSLQLPIKLLFPYSDAAGDAKMSLLGLGDIAIPGIFVCFALHFDAHLHRKGSGADDDAAEDTEALLAEAAQPKAAPRRSAFQRYAYFLTALGGYQAGLLASMAAVVVFQTAQPALLYIVPSTILPILALGARRGHLHQLWNGVGAAEAARRDA